MHTSRSKFVFVLVAVAFLIAGLVLPLWFIAVLGALLLSILVPVAGVFAGFLLDILYGAPPFLPAYLGFPCLFATLLLGIVSLYLRKYLR